LLLAFKRASSLCEANWALPARQQKLSLASLGLYTLPVLYTVPPSTQCYHMVTLIGARYCIPASKRGASAGRLIATYVVSRYSSMPS
jgi:hypothetical protein